VDVGAVAVVVDPDLGMAERLLDRHERLQDLVADLDELARPLGGGLVDRRHGRDGVAHHADLVRAQRLLVLRHGQDAKLHARQVVAGDDAVHAGKRAGPRRIDGEDAGVAVGRAQELRVRHARQDEVIGVPGLAGDLRPRVDLRQRLSDHRELVLLACHAAPVVTLARPAMRSAASSTASRILV
jgi:hypothetical protein